MLLFRLTLVAAVFLLYELSCPNCLISRHKPPYTISVVIIMSESREGEMLYEAVIRFITDRFITELIYQYGKTYSGRSRVHGFYEAPVPRLLQK